MESPTSYEVSTLLDALLERKGNPADLIDTLERITQTARTFLQASICTIFAINPITHRLIATRTASEKFLANDIVYNQTQLEDLIQRTIEKESLLLPNLEALSEYQYLRLKGMSSFASLPLRLQHNQKPLGILCLYFTQPELLNTKQQLFQIFSAQASFILQETWLLRRHQEVARIGQEINRELSDVGTLFEKLQKHSAGIPDTNDALMLTTYEPQTNTLDFYVKEKGPSTSRQGSPLEGAWEHVIQTQKSLFIAHLSMQRGKFPFMPDSLTSAESFIYVPLVLHNVPLGTLSTQHSQPNAYTQEDLFILQMLANHIALALYNIRLYSSLRLLNDTGQLLTQQLDPEQTLQITADQIRDTTKADIVVLYPYSHGLQSFIPPPYVAGQLKDPSTEQLMIPRRPDDIATLLVSRENPVFAKESSTLYTILMGNIDIRQGNFQQRESIRSTAATRLKVSDELVGVLFINFRQPQLFDSPQTLLIEGLSHFAAIAISNARMLNKVMQRRLRELEILQKIDRELNRNLGLQRVLDTLIELTADIVPAESAAIMLYDPNTQLLETKSAIGSDANARQTLKIHYTSASGITRWVLEHKKPVRVDNVRRPPWSNIYIPAGDNTLDTHIAKSAGIDRFKPGQSHALFPNSARSLGGS